MNPSIEACQKCPEKESCPLDAKAEAVLEEYRSGEIEKDDVSTKIGRVSQIGNQKSCPSREIKRVRKELFKEMAPGRYNPNDSIGISPKNSFPSYDSGNLDRLDTGRSVRRR